MGGRDNRLGVAKSAARTFVGALRPDDQVMIVAIGGETTIVAPLSTGHAAALAAIDRLDAWGTTPLYDATVGALDAIQPARGRRALVLLSDGTDRYSDTKAADLVDTRAAPRRADLSGRGRRRKAAGVRGACGGDRWAVVLCSAIRPRSTSTMTTIARELRFQYLLGYTPSRERAGEPSWHAIDVTVTRPDLRVRAREGYSSR